MEKVENYIKDVLFFVARAFCYLVLFVEGCLPVGSSLNIPVVDYAYVKKIDTPTIGSKKVKKALDKFNKIGYSRVVSYERKFIPIWIFESYLAGGSLGVALPTVIGCIIILDPYMRDEAQIEHVVIHEYVHCLGYDHTYDPRDLMYREYVPDQGSNYKHYVDEILKRK